MSYSYGHFCRRSWRQLHHTYVDNISWTALLSVGQHCSRPCVKQTILTRIWKPLPTQVLPDRYDSLNMYFILILILIRLVFFIVFVFCVCKSLCARCFLFYCFLFDYVLEFRHGTLKLDSMQLVYDTCCLQIETSFTNDININVVCIPYCFIISLVNF